MSSPIREWSEDDRPREKLLKCGVEVLSNAELLAIILRTGNKNESAVELSRRILSSSGFREIIRWNDSKWRKIKGIGNAKLCEIKAVFEIARRLQLEKFDTEKIPIKTSLQAADLVMPQMKDLVKEQMRVLFLDASNRLIKNEIVEQGTVNFAQPIIREIFHKAIDCSAVSLILVHNHPSGAVKPSHADKTFTSKVIQASLALDIKVLDHLIIGGDGFFSFRDQGMI